MKSPFGSLQSPFRRRALGTGWICKPCNQRNLARRLASTKSPRGALPSTPARTRFAPSPTGFLHLGSLRTALFNHLLAKATGGQFLLRIENTDTKRTIPGAEDRIFQDLRWAGLQWDEGPKVGGPHGPYRQSERIGIYEEHAQKLLDTGHAYRCFCSSERLFDLAKQRSDLGLPTNYDRKCTHVPTEEAEDRAAQGESHVIRLKSPLVYPEFQDLVYGPVRNKVAKREAEPTYEDPILLKTDGFPTYHFANVVDDYLMKITHVVRGAEWMSSTPKHIALYQAFGWDPPSFAHVGLLMDVHGQKLSKRNLDIDIASYRDRMGILPESLINFLALLGWSHREKNDFMSLEDLVRNFSMKFTTGDTVVTFEKLWYLQKKHVASYMDLATNSDGTSKLDALTRPILDLLHTDNFESTDDLKSILAGRTLKEYTEEILKLGAREYSNASDFLRKYRYFFQPPTQPELLENPPNFRQSATPSPVILPTRAETIELFQHHLTSIAAKDWSPEYIPQVLQKIISTFDIEGKMAAKGAEEEDAEGRRKMMKAWPQFVHVYVRWALLAGVPGPASSACLVALGRDESLRRFELAAGVVLSAEE